MRVVSSVTTIVGFAAIFFGLMLVSALLTGAVRGQF
jgi:hypothetical protein